MTKEELAKGTAKEIDNSKQTTGTKHFIGKDGFIYSTREDAVASFKE